MTKRTCIAAAALLLTVAVFSCDRFFPSDICYEGDAQELLKDEPHPRRYYPIWKKMLQGDNETSDLGVIVPYNEVPQHDPRIPY